MHALVLSGSASLKLIRAILPIHEVTHKYLHAKASNCKATLSNAKKTLA